ncbi:MAG: hypothetical protein SAK29_33420 [Scytonema sp. PMC 1069.18]|nr:hypothetical protein [Scytonema sp. PMC 1069.18]MEC4887422.1 hypothetical protein [Scytonema sp. PMC 1070.18]
MKNILIVLLMSNILVCSYTLLSLMPSVYQKENQGSDVWNVTVQGVKVRSPFTHAY